MIRSFVNRLLIQVFLGDHEQSSQKNYCVNKHIVLGTKQSHSGAV